MTKVMFNFQYHKGIIKLESKFLYECVKHVLYFLESAAALNEFKSFFALIMFIMLHGEFLHDNLHLNC